MKNKSYLYRFTHHFHTISTHKVLVMRLCFKLGLYRQGLAHDLSKYSLLEFFSGVKYYQGNRSPILAEREDLGYSEAWLHHKGINKHHLEYWTMRNGNGYIGIKIPDEYILESLCDRIAASKIYLKEKYNDSSAYDYFMNFSDYQDMEDESAEIMKRLLAEVRDKGLDKAFEDIRRRYYRNKL